MSHPIDVGSVLGGRYKVTATVLTSHDHDLVLDGVDQVLNRPVSILVAGPDNAEQVAQSAREVATGERPGNVQILDLGVSDSTTYLITNHTSAADLLDLVVASNPPYVEPFFTDTLGSEIFGHARSHEPETYDGQYDEEEVEAGYINYGNNHPAAQDRKQSSPPVVPPVVPPRAAPVRPASAPSVGSAGSGAGAARPGGARGNGVGAAAAGAAGAAGLAAGAAAAGRDSKSPSTAPQATTPQQAVHNGGRDTEAINTQAPAAESPKVSLWEDNDYEHPEEEAPSTGPARTARERMAATFPAFAGGGRGDETDEYYDDEEPPEREPRSMRWLVGGLLAAVLVVGLIFAVSNLGSLFKSEPQTNPAPGNSSNTSQPQTTGAPTATESSAPVAGPPAVEGVSRLGNFDFAATYDGDLSKTFDGNGASYWSDMEFATDNWGGLAPDVSLVVKLKSPSKVSSITLSQLGGSGGNISVLTNDRPSLEGAKQVGTNSFTSPDLTMPLSEPVTAQYVIVSIKNLPKLAAPKTRFGYGLRLAEIKVQ
ncbi:ABC transporter substrate-binding protein [Arthrobacter sp. SPG23]|uniref:ABC transporter substrate-binding protein n=1 Tax=Arthrobacter sp. SPG23 TaxID=1610703 RepID=UPI0005BB1523|nr:ABC transporter substrate-binding protein [Arthrobacter sp. SPG23]KIS28185.1 ABC transporter substrate-binding protein [Arthrobacter sp. SPG23]